MNPNYHSQNKILKKQKKKTHKNTIYTFIINQNHTYNSISQLHLLHKKHLHHHSQKKTLIQNNIQTNIKQKNLNIHNLTQLPTLLIIQTQIQLQPPSPKTYQTSNSLKNKKKKNKSYLIPKITITKFYTKKIP